MFLSGLLPRPMTADDDQKLLEHGIGFTNIVERTTKGTANLTRREIEEGNKGILNVQQIVLYVFLSFQRMNQIYIAISIFRQCNAYAKNPAISTKNCCI